MSHDRIRSLRRGQSVVVGFGEEAKIDFVQNKVRIFQHDVESTGEINIERVDNVVLVWSQGAYAILSRSIDPLCISGAAMTTSRSRRLTA